MTPGRPGASRMCFFGAPLVGFRLRGFQGASTGAIVEAWWPGPVWDTGVIAQKVLHLPDASLDTLGGRRKVGPTLWFTVLRPPPPGRPARWVRLPISHAYSRYLGGDLHVAPIDGHGTNVYITMPRFAGGKGADGDDDECLDFCTFMPEVQGK